MSKARALVHATVGPDLVTTSARRPGPRVRLIGADAQSVSLVRLLHGGDEDGHYVHLVRLPRGDVAAPTTGVNRARHLHAVDAVA
ncbi:MAG: hypothetical protein WA359_09220, partial [Acidimicrobiales bacterium]